VGGGVAGGALGCTCGPTEAADDGAQEQRRSSSDGGQVEKKSRR
jgi:hypothetical protein